MNTYFIDISVNIDNKSIFVTLKTETKYPINSYETMSIRYLIKEIFVKLVFFVLFFMIFSLLYCSQYLFNELFHLYFLMIYFSD